MYRPLYWVDVMKTEGNQGFTSFDFLTLVFSFALIFFVSVPILQKNLNSGEIEVAQRDAEAIARTLVNPNDTSTFQFLTNAQAQQKRGIASVNPAKFHRDPKWTGEAGKDPWGRPYRYVFIRGASGAPTHVVVWSEGPNGKNEMPELDQSAKLPEQGHLAFRGDDVGSVTPVY
jgi:hypothetical protein